MTFWSLVWGRTRSGRRQKGLSLPTIYENTGALWLARTRHYTLYKTPSQPHTSPLNRGGPFLFRGGQGAGPRSQSLRGWVQTRPSSPTASRHSQRHNSVIYMAVWALLILSPHGGQDGRGVLSSAHCLCRRSGDHRQGFPHPRVGALWARRVVLPPAPSPITQHALQVATPDFD